VTAKSKDYYYLNLHSSFHFKVVARVFAYSKVKNLFAKLMFVDFMQNFAGKQVRHSILRGNNLH